MVANHITFVDSDGRVCTKCGEYKLWDHFGKSSSKTTTKHNSWCKLCLNAWSRERYSGTKAKRGHRLKSLYGLTLEEFEFLREQQSNKCPVCRTVFEANPHVDHSHVTGAVRGLLCRCCNVGLAMFKDNPDYLRSAIKYLESRNEQA